MKKLIYVSFLFLLFFSCREDFEGIQNPAEEKTVPVTFALSLNNIEQATEIHPMSRSDEPDPIVKVQINNPYKVIVIKKTDSGWMIDDIVEPKLKNTAIYQSGPFSDLTLQLRPGEYKIAVLLNSNEMRWNPAIKAGAFVSDRPDITETDDLPLACTYFKETLKNGYTYEGLGQEVFTGNIQLTVEKNKDLSTPGYQAPVTIRLERKVARFRYLLQRNSEAGGPDLIATQYYLSGTYVPQNGQVLPDGLNILGGIYYDRQHPRKEHKTYFSSITNNFYLSPLNGKSYSISTSNSTNYFPFLLADPDIQEGLDCTLKDIVIAAQSGKPKYIPQEDFNFTLKNNTIFGLVYETLKQREAMVIEVKQAEGNVSEIFDSYFEWNVNSYDVDKR